ncbi:MAG TPA: cobyric acid synthase [Gemmatimonadaceae bacterium]
MRLARLLRFDDTAHVINDFDTSAGELNPRDSAPAGRVLMVQGTSSHAGKSTLVAALCRLFARAGYRVAPFKAQNMSNNAAVTDDGREVGRAQAMQAVAARVPVTVDMNPVLLKPQSDRTSQVVVLGKATRAYNAREYYDRTAELWPVVTGALDRLRAAYDIVVVEGAGSPAEINLERYDIVNMRVARYAQAPVLVVGDIDRGGVFASLFGTWALLPDGDRGLIRGYIINKFRGDPSLLDPGFDILRERTGVPTLGVLPYLDLSRLPAEDALEWESLNKNANKETLIDIAVMRLPRVANLDEFQPLVAEPGVTVRFVGSSDELGHPDLIIIPGTKSTIADLAWLRERGLASAIAARRANNTPVLGICGGYQMLGVEIIDEQGVEAEGNVPGLGLLPVSTAFVADKITHRVSLRITADNAIFAASAVAFDAYEIHMGRTTPIPNAHLGSSPFLLTRDRVDFSDGACSDDGLVVGTYMHGMLENDDVRRILLERIAARKGVSLPARQRLATVDQAIDALADSVATNLDLDAIGELVGLRLLSPT